MPEQPASGAPVRRPRFTDRHPLTRMFPMSVFAVGAFLWLSLFLGARLRAQQDPGLAAAPRPALSRSSVNGSPAPLVSRGSAGGGAHTSTGASGGAGHGVAAAVTTRGSGGGVLVSGEDD